MPVYNFYCPKCNKVSEDYSSMSERNNRKCGKCQTGLSIHIGNPSVRVHNFKLDDKFSYALGRVVHNKQDFKDGLTLKGFNADMILDGGAY